MSHKNAKLNPKAIAGRERKANLEAEKVRIAELEMEDNEAKEWEAGANLRGAIRETARANRDAERAAASKAKKEALIEEDLAISGIKTNRMRKVKPSDDVSALLAAGLASEKKSKSQFAPKSKIVPYDSNGHAQETKNGIVFRNDNLSMGGGNNLHDEAHNQIESATGIDAAIGLFGVDAVPKGSGPALKDDSRNRKALYLAYKEKMLPIVKSENPGLRLTQYEDRIFDLWKRAPENPANRDHIR